MPERGKAARIHETGGPEVMKWEEVSVGDPGPGEIRVRHSAVGLNFIDIYLRSGARPVPLPSGMGLEAAGVIDGLHQRGLRVAIPPGDNTATAAALAAQAGIIDVTFATVSRPST